MPGAEALWLGPTEGQPLLRRAIADRAGIRPAQVLVPSSAQQGLDLISRCLLDPGDTIVIDRPGYLGAIHSSAPPEPIWSAGMSSAGMWRSLKTCWCATGPSSCTPTPRFRIQPDGRWR
ncbi:MAG: aminotransferase class I/II-fold pyridoxal phosphate-dependent enzyme [Chloroflexia bacterium]|nr:aminotransferase class I/II-fold pyridoxal phosphate-dependent enzyme [Chloroflexia bacterium]